MLMLRDIKSGTLNSVTVWGVDEHGWFLVCGPTTEHHKAFALIKEAEATGVTCIPIYRDVQDEGQDFDYLALAEG